jgi:tetratricopeptide (TPR) repeat protein
MRFAVVVQPPIPGESDGPTSTRAGELRSRLLLGGYRVVDLLTTPDLPDHLARAMEDVGQSDSVLLYLACATHLSDERPIALRLGASDEQALQLSAVAELVKARRPKDALLVVDAMHDGADDDAMVAAEHADAVVRAIGGHEAELGALIGVHPRRRGGRPSRTWPFTKLFLEALDDPATRDPGGAARASRLFESVRDKPEISVEVPSFALVKGGSDFVVLDSAPAPLGSAPPPSRSSVPPPPRSRSSIPPSRGSLPVGAFPALEPILEAAAEARQKMDYERALDEYKKALMLAGADDAAARASLYASVGEVKRAMGKPREAELNFEKALACVPAHRRSVEALITLAVEASEWDRAATYRRKLVDLADTDAKKLTEYHRLADVYEFKAKDLKRAIDVLKEGASLAPGDAPTLDRLKHLCEVTSDWQGVVDVLAARCRSVTEAPRRAAIRFAQADIVLARMRDERRGVGLLEAAIEEDPALDKAVAALVAVRSRREEWAEIERLYTRLIDRYAERGDAERAWGVCKELGVLRRDKILDGPGAIDSLRGALRCKPDDFESRAMLAELLIAKGDRDEAMLELERVAASSPMRRPTYRRLFDLATRAGLNDRAWLLGCVLQELGGGDVNAELFVEQHRAAGEARPASSMDEDAWETLRAPGTSPELVALLRAITPAAVAVRVEELAARKALVTLDPATLQVPTSTASVVRSFAFAGQVLGIAVPDLYLMDEVPGGLGAIQASRPSTAFGLEVSSGLGLPELAFIAGRHLTYYRPEHYALVFFPTLADLSALLFAMVKLSRPKATIPPGASEAAARWSESIGKIMSDDEKDAALDALAALDKKGGRLDLGAFIRSAELTATRAGCVLAGSLQVAAERLRTETRGVADLTYEDRRADLCAFLASRGATDVRRALGVALP